MIRKVPSSFCLLGCVSICAYFIYYFTASNFHFPNPTLSFKETVKDGTFESVLKFLNNYRSEIQESDEDSCRKLMQYDGHLKCFLNSPPIRKFQICPLQKSFWQPMGCDMHNYDTRVIRECMKNITSTTVKKEILMLGDSRVRHLYLTFKHKLQNKVVHSLAEKIHHEKYEDKETGLTLNFFTRLLTDQETIGHLREVISTKPRPFVLFIGNALHSMMNSNGTLEGLRSYRRNFIEMVPLLEILTKTTTVIWMIQSPVVTSYGGVANLLIQLYNSVAVELLHGTHVHIMYSARSIGIATIHNYLDNPHLGIVADKMVVEIILNFVCNRYVTIQEEVVCCRH